MADTTAEVVDGEEPDGNWVSWILDTEDPAASVDTGVEKVQVNNCLLYTSPSPRD